MMLWVLCVGEGYIQAGAVQFLLLQAEQTSLVCLEGFCLSRCCR